MSKLADFLQEIEAEARAAGPEAVEAFYEAQQRHAMGALILARRRELEMTQKELAALSGIDQADISKIENAEANPTLDTLGALARALRTTIGIVPLDEAPTRAPAPAVRPQQAMRTRKAALPFARTRRSVVATRSATAATASGVTGARAQARTGRAPT